MWTRLAVCSDDKHRQSAPGQRFLSWQFESFKYDGQIWKVLLPGILANNCLSRGLVLKTLTCAWIILKSQKDWKGNHDLNWFVQRLEYGFYRGRCFVSNWPRGAPALIRLICAAGRWKRLNPGSCLTTNLKRGLVVLRCNFHSLPETRVAMQVGVDSFKQRKKKKKRKTDIWPKDETSFLSHFSGGDSTSLQVIEVKYEAVSGYFKFWVFFCFAVAIGQRGFHVSTSVIYCNSQQSLDKDTPLEFI